MTTVKGRHEAADGLPSRELFRSRQEGGSRAWKRWMALAGLIGAPIAGALSACAFLLAYVNGTADLTPQFTSAGDVLIVLVLPLLILGAVALDWLEADRGTGVARHVTRPGRTGSRSTAR
jgi:hypothetical protein